MMYTAIVIAVIGLAIQMIHPQAISLAEFSDKYKFDIAIFLQQIASGNSYGILTLAVIVLMCIPIMRIVLYVVEFGLQRNKLYFMISLLICIILGTSIFLGR